MAGFIRGVWSRGYTAVQGWGALLPSWASTARQLRHEVVGLNT